MKSTPVRQPYAGVDFISHVRIYEFGYTTLTTEKWDQEAVCRCVLVNLLPININNFSLYCFIKLKMVNNL